MTSTADQLSQLKDFLAHIATVNTDLSNITAPPFVLAKKSAVEFPAAWCSHQPLFLAQGEPTEPEERALAVLKNFLCSLKAQTYTGSSEKDGAKKPLNAFLGELFLATFDGSDGASHLISEQVSHHPPVTACYLYNQKHAISAEGYVAQETSFSPAHGVTVKQIGHAVIHLDSHNEHHMITLPTLNVRSILSGSPYPELSGTCHIVSTTGLTSRISFEGKKLFGTSKKNSFHAELYHTENPDEIIYEVTGQWSGSFKVHYRASKKDVETIDVNSLDMTPLKTLNLENQDPWESRRAWSKVIAGIEDQNIKTVSQEKTKIEEAQRGLRRQENAEGTKWPRLFFARKFEDSLAKDLAAVVGEPLHEERTDGVWRFIGLEKATRIKRPFHPDCLPTGRI